MIQQRGTAMCICYLAQLNVPEASGVHSASPRVARSRQISCRSVALLGGGSTGPQQRSGNTGWVTAPPLTPATTTGLGFFPAASFSLPSTVNRAMSPSFTAAFFLQNPSLQFTCSWSISAHPFSEGPSQTAGRLQTKP